MSLKFEDEYAQTLDNLALALERSYDQIKQTSKFSGNFDYSEAVATRLRAFYQSQLAIKSFLKKSVAQAGSDFFVETVIFFLRLFIDIENLDLDISSERQLERKRNSMRPDISIWRNNKLLAVIECKTQLGWHRQNWYDHFQYREQQLKEVFPEAEIFLVVMTSCNWGGFGDNSKVGKQLFCLSNLWPTDSVFILDTPIEQLFERIKLIAGN